MALVDPRLLDKLHTSTKPPVDMTLRDLDAEMTNILDKIDIDVSEKVRLYNQALLRYNDMTKLAAAKPTPVVVVTEQNADAPGVMAEVVTTLPKGLQEKGRQLVSRLKTIKWNDRGELLHEGVVVPGRKTGLTSSTIYCETEKHPNPLDGNSSPVRCTQPTYQWNWLAMSLGGNIYRNVHEYRHQHRNQRKVDDEHNFPNEYRLQHRNQRNVDEHNFWRIGSLIKTIVSSRDRNIMSRQCVGVVVVSVVVIAVVFLAVLLSTSPQSYIRCPGAVTSWGDRNYRNDTTIPNALEVMVELLLCEEQFPNRT